MSTSLPRTHKSRSHSTTQTPTPKKSAVEQRAEILTPPPFPFVTRSPIFSSHLQPYAYELIFPSLAETSPKHNTEIQIDKKDQAKPTFSSAPPHGLLAFTRKIFHVLSDQRRCLIHIPEELLLSPHLLTVLPADSTIVALPPTLTPPEQVTEIYRHYVQHGYKVCFDGFQLFDARAPLLTHGGFIRVDFSAMSHTAARSIRKRLPSKQAQLIADNVDTHAARNAAFTTGMDFVQGLFFCCPDLDEEKQEFSVNKITCMRLLRLIHQTEIDLPQIEQTIKQDIALTYRLLLHINSAAFGLRIQVKSVHQALVLLGERGIRQWGSLTSVTSMAKDKPTALVTTSLIRARMCESTANLLEYENSSELFLLGLFSLIDAATGEKMHSLLERIPLAPRLKKILLSLENDAQNIFATDMPSPFGEILTLAISYERGNWHLMHEASSRLGLHEDLLPGIYLSAVEWASITLLNHRRAEKN